MAHTLCTAAATLTVSAASASRDGGSPARKTPAAPRVILEKAQRVAMGAVAATTLAVAAPAVLPDQYAPHALAIPQTSDGASRVVRAAVVLLTHRCATKSCDDNDYSNRDLTSEFYTKGSLKRANFSGSNLAGVTLFGADLSGANFTGADLTNANIGQCNLTGTIFKDANLSGAIVSGANMDDVGDIDGSDWTDVIVRKDVNDRLCAKDPQGINAVTGNPTAMTLFCN